MGGRFRRHILLIVIGSGFCLLLIPGVEAAPPAREEKVGFVLAIFGKWTLEGAPGQPLRLGQALPAGGRVRGTAPDVGTGYITIALLNGNEITRSCEESRGCGAAVVLPDSIGTSPSLVRRIVSAVLELFAHEPETYISPMGRGRGELREAVVELRDGRADLAPAFAEMEPGLHLCQLTALSGSPSKPLVLIVGEDGRAEISLAGVAPGLYQLMLLDRERRAPMGVEAWVLLAPSSRHEALHRRFSEAVSLVGGWSPDVRPEAVRSFLRAFLQALALESGDPS